jgi:hypothetical protein
MPIIPVALDDGVVAQSRNAAAFNIKPSVMEK